MTGLAETLPILDQAVPALSTKLEAVARQADSFHQAAGEALVIFKHKREAAEALSDQLRDALSAVHAQAARVHPQVETATGEVEAATDHEMRGADESESELSAAAAQAASAFGSLESELAHGAAATRSVHEEARRALDALSERARTSLPEVEAACDQMDSSVNAAQQAVTDGQALVEDGVVTLTAVLARLLGAAEQRLAETYSRLEELRGQQERAVAEAVSELETGRADVEQQVTARLETVVKEALDPELDAASGELAEMSRRVLHLGGESESARESVERERAEIEERMPALQGGVDQVRQAARKVGIDWR